MLLSTGCINQYYKARGIRASETTNRQPALPGKQKNKLAQAIVIL